MNYTIIYSRQSREDLKNIYEYIAFELLVQETAQEQVRRIMKNIRSLEDMPNRFKLYEYEPWHSMGLRYFPIDNYLVFYLPKETEVHIVRVIYGGRDIHNQLSV